MVRNTWCAGVALAALAAVFGTVRADTGPGNTGPGDTAPSDTARPGEVHQGGGEAAHGRAVYEALCADCHGAMGQGSDYHRVALAGDLPPVELARVIADTMPEGDAESCVGDDARAVAEYVYGEFYSPLAQARVRPPRRELSRLTVRQLRQSLADLLAEARGRKQPADEHGIAARFTQKVNVASVAATNRVLERAAFRLSDYTELPEAYRDPDAEGPEEFGNRRLDVHARLVAGLYAPRTGLYEFSVRSPNGFVFSLNEAMLIDARVSSGADEAPRATAWLVGGRVYELELKTSRIRERDLEFDLRWLPPGGVEETIPRRMLSPSGYPPSHSVVTRFPPDDRSVGYVRGAAISPEWHEAATAAALETAKAVVDDLARCAGRKRGSEPTTEEALAACGRLAEFAFRRPLADAERRRYVDRFFAADAGESPVVNESVERSLLAVLTSPAFLYPELAFASADANARPGRVATRLALGLWDSIPDERLRVAVSERRLETADQVRRQAIRMVADFRTESKLSEFFEHWLRLDHVGRLIRDKDAFPGFDDRVAADMRASLELLIDDVVWRGDGDLRRLFLADDLYVNQRLAGFLGIQASLTDADSPDAFVSAPADHEQRVGVAAHPFMVTALSYHRDTSPIHRGVFLARHVLGRSLRPPPEAVAPLAPELAPDLTTRERVALQTGPPACQTCHVMINNLGFTLEHFDAVGRYRATDAGESINASGGYVATDGESRRLSGARELAEYLAASEDVHRSFVVQLFEHVTKQPMLAYGEPTQEALLRGFRESGYNVRELLADIAVTAALAD